MLYVCCLNCVFVMFADLYENAPKDQTKRPTPQPKVPVVFTSKTLSTLDIVIKLFNLHVVLRGIQNNFYNNMFS